MMKIALLTGMLVTAMASGGSSAPAAPAEDGHDDGHSTGGAIVDGECPSYCPYSAAGAFDPDAIGNPKNNATCASVAARTFRIAKTKAASETGHSLVDECLYAADAIFEAGCCNKGVYPCEICPEGRINEDDITFNTTVGDKRTCGAALTEFDDGLYRKKSMCKGINSYLVCAGCCIAPEVEEIHHEEDSYSGHGEEESAYGYGDDDHGDSHDDHGDDHGGADADSHDDHGDAEDSHDDHADADTHDEETHTEETHTEETHDNETHTEEEHAVETHDEETHTEEEHAVETHDEEEHAEETHDDTDNGLRRRMSSSGGGSAAKDPAPADAAGCTNKWEGGSKNYETGKCSCKPALQSYLYEDEENSSFSAAPVLLSALLPAAILYIL